MTRWSIRTRLAVWFAAVLGAVLVLLASATGWALRRSFAVTIDENLAGRVSAIGRFLGQPDSVPASEEMRDDLREYVALDPGWDLIRISDATGVVLYRSKGFDVRGAPPAQGGDTPSPGVYWMIVTKGRPLRVLTSQVQVGRQRYTVEVAAPMREAEQALRRFVWAWVLLVPAGVIAAAAGGYWISRRALAPVDRIATTARAITAERLGSRLDVPPTGDELQRLSVTLNEMLDRLEAAFREIIRFTADASHELRTPVSLIRTSAEVTLRRPRSPDEYRRALQEILAEAKRTSTLVQDLLTLSRADAGVDGLRRDPVDLNALIETAANQLAVLCRQRGLAFEADVPGCPVLVIGDRAALGRLILVLADNAVKYTPPPGTVRIALHDSGTEALIEVRDTGIGIGADDLPRVFDRFYRADRARSRDAGGAGLGLSIARWVAGQHGARLWIESVPGAGCVARLLVPRLSAGHGDSSGFTGAGS